MIQRRVALTLTVLGIVLAGSGCALTSKFGWGGDKRATPEGPARVFSCDSRDHRRNYCAADTRQGIRLLEQRSSFDCVLGSTWGYDNRSVWVARGCSADFIEGPYDLAGKAPAQRVQCESRNNRMTRCNAVVHTGVRLVEPLSDTRCVQRQNWGWDRTGVWVSGGCGAMFEAQ
ncbi:DUF3011 domain-containing protein [Luteimonas abyssi]|uniref:DUF3011 domain-containing protein n=1 Tax=Luteimonas abyssi TaxID=1247514 RepID=UPI0009EB6B1E|nr:DUF3011 domain-containing protein [Luteimonas abyssi]